MTRQITIKHNCRPSDNVLDVIIVHRHNPFPSELPGRTKYLIVSISTDLPREP
jgi:hypothetical protein